MNLIAWKIFRLGPIWLSKELIMTKKLVFAALPLILSLMTPVTAKALPRHTSERPTLGIVGRQVAAPPWSAACMSDHGPTECNEPMWVYGSPAEVSRYNGAY